MSEDFVVLEGKSLDSLIEEGIKKLETDKEHIDVEILESKKNIFNTYFKVKISSKLSKKLEKLEESLEDLLSNAQVINMEGLKKDIELFYENDGVYIILNRALQFTDIKNEVDYRRVQNVDFELLRETLAAHQIGDKLKIAEKQEVAKIDCTCEVRFGSDHMEAYVYITAPIEGADVSEKMLRNVLAENKITYGILEEEIIRIVHERPYGREIKIAQGVYPIAGEDAKLEYHFDTSTETKLLEAEDGRIDFRELSLIKNTKAGQVLVTMIPATAGSPGKNIKGEEVKPREGKKLQMPKGKNVAISDNGLQLVSSIDGEIKVIDDKVNVFAIYMVSANVDNSTGNIRFIGKVIVKGNVLTGFTIEADGDVEIFGVVEGAKIISKQNIILHRGIQGMNKGELYCDGDLVAKFIENSIIEVKGNIKSDAIMHSHVVCGKKLEASGKKGLLVGGSFKVADEIKAKVIGSHMATVTELEVGVNPEMRKKYEQFKQERKSITDNLEKVTQAVDLLTKISKKAELPPEKKEMLTKSIQAKLQLTQQLTLNSKELKELEIYLEELSKGKIKVSDVIYPGARVTIGSSIMYVKDVLKYLTLHRANAEIKIGPYEN